jgi:ribonucleoside-diphosphate reductase alpha chain
MHDYGPKTLAADSLHAMKYRSVGEDFREAMNRVAFGLKDSDTHYHELRKILLDQRFCPGGRIQNAIGSSRSTTGYNCFVSGTIADSFVEGHDSIMARAKEAAATMRMGGGIGYDFSSLRPRGDLITKLQSHSSGPVSFMKIFDAICLATASSGHRRGAQMGVMRIDHPNIEEFVRAKQNDTDLRGFNISIAVTDAFMEALATGKPFPLRYGSRVYQHIDAEALWEKVMRSTWDFAEPGVLFIDTINRMNNLWYCEKIAATNPCGEQPLPPFGACLLGSFNLVKYLRMEAVIGDEVQYTFDYDQLSEDIPIVIRGMDNVIDRTLYPLAEQRAEAISKRRMGLGVMGLANTIEALGAPYGTSAFLAQEADILGFINYHCYEASVELAKEKGAFPLFDAERYCSGPFIQSLPEELRYSIAHNGIRNSHLTSIAPTGTISLCADNVSGGLEPVFSYETQRQINTPDGAIITTVRDYGYEYLNVKGRLASDVSAMEHIGVLATAQKFVDSAVSKTVNMTSKMPWDDFKQLYTAAWELGCKGCATFNSDGKRGALLVAQDDNKQTETAIACYVDPETGQRSCE